MTVNSWSPCVHFSSAEITGLAHLLGRAFFQWTPLEPSLPVNFFSTTPPQYFLLMHCRLMFKYILFIRLPLYWKCIWILLVRVCCKTWNSGFHTHWAITLPQSYIYGPKLSFKFPGIIINLYILYFNYVLVFLVIIHIMMKVEKC